MNFGDGKICHCLFHSYPEGERRRKIILTSFLVRLLPLKNLYYLIIYSSLTFVSISSNPFGYKISGRRSPWHESNLKNFIVRRAMNHCLS